MLHMLTESCLCLFFVDDRITQIPVITCFVLDRLRFNKSNRNIIFLQAINHGDSSVLVIHLLAYTFRAEEMCVHQFGTMELPKKTIMGIVYQLIQFALNRCIDKI